MPYRPLDCSRSILVTGAGGVSSFGGSGTAASCSVSARGRVHHSLRHLGPRVLASAAASSADLACQRLEHQRAFAFTSAGASSLASLACLVNHP